MGEKAIFTLDDTVDGMTSGDWRDRFVAEFDQLTIRVRQLHDMIVEMDEGTLQFSPACSRTVLRGQLSAMNAYRGYLKIRAKSEGFKPEDFAAWVI